MRTLQNDLGVLAESFDAVRALSCPPTSVVGGAARFIVRAAGGAANGLNPDRIRRRQVNPRRTS